MFNLITQTIPVKQESVFPHYSPLLQVVTETLFKVKCLKRLKFVLGFCIA